jgi:hypothetical protein
MAANLSVQAILSSSKQDNSPGLNIRTLRRPKKIPPDSFEGTPQTELVLSSGRAGGPRPESSREGGPGPEPVFVDLVRSPGIDSQPGGPVRNPVSRTGPPGYMLAESIPGLHKRLQIRAQSTVNKIPRRLLLKVLRRMHCIFGLFFIYTRYISYMTC